MEIYCIEVYDIAKLVEDLTGIGENNFLDRKKYFGYEKK